MICCRTTLRLLFVFLFAARALGAVRNGALELNPTQLQPGTIVDLTGEWRYQPGYAVKSNEQPANASSPDNFKVEVPQLLNRIHWWLDDSEDFKRSETARLKRLEFDTERAEDGWYYLRVSVPALPSGRHVFVEFEGVAMIARVYCNGQNVGNHKGMFSRFACDLTPALRAGDNLLAVYVAMEKIPPSTLSMGEAVTVNLTASKVKTMSKGMFGPLSPNFDNRAYDLHGIWQPVKLVVRGNGRLEDVWFVPGLDGAEVRVQASALGERTSGRISARWLDGTNGTPFAQIKPEPIQFGSMHSLVLTNVHPQWWTPAAPHLYRLEVRLESESGELLDLWAHKVGFRTFEVRSNQFFLNGKPYWLLGANHLPYGKNPFDPALAKVLIGALHQANVRVTRTHATPWNEAWLDAADEIGLGVSLEGIRPWALAGKIGATPPDLFAHWLMENEDVVKRARNHPSVFIYTVGNEMLLRDPRNLEKWQQLSDVVKQTRRLDPTRPVICSSDYTREPELYESLLKPNGIDDGDADDMHRYNNWYAPSSFVTDAKFEKELATNRGLRPLIGQEMSSGYPDLDSGLPVLRYTRDLLTPQAWIGDRSLPGNDPSVFLEHHRAVTKRWAERLRFERTGGTAGFMLFAAECWFSHSYDPGQAKPYPVVEAVRQAFTPVGLALKTGRRRFFGGEQVQTQVFIINDDEEGRDLAGLRLELVTPVKGGDPIELGRLERLAYGQVQPVQVRIDLPQVSGRQRLPLTLRLMAGSVEVSRTTDWIELFPSMERVKMDATFFTRNLGPQFARFLQSAVGVDLRTEPAGSGVLLLGKGDNGSGLEPGGVLGQAVENGATAIVFSPTDKVSARFAPDLYEAKSAPGEFVDFAPCAGTPLAEKLEPMDLKWWGREGDDRVFVADTSHRLRKGGGARELMRYIPPHSYISADKVAEQYRVALAEVPRGRGRIWVCDLDLEASVLVDPAAKQFAVNLLRAAAEPGSKRKR